MCQEHAKTHAHQNAGRCHAGHEPAHVEHDHEREERVAAHSQALGPLPTSPTSEGGDGRSHG